MIIKKKSNIHNSHLIYNKKLALNLRFASGAENLKPALLVQWAVAGLTIVRN